MRYIYNFCFYLLLPFIFLRLVWRSQKSVGYRYGWKQRLGHIDFKTEKPVLWLHAVSLGESIAATPLLKNLQAAYPNYTIVVTNMTVTGATHIQKTLADTVQSFFIPYDYPGAVKRFLTTVKPQIAIMMETELWPNVFHYCHRLNIPILIANARLSESSAFGYRLIKSLAKTMLKQATCIAAQTAADAERFIALGADPANVKITGNIKFDIKPTAAALPQGKALREKLGNSNPVWIAASTHSGEESIILAAQQRIALAIPNVKLIMVPRHPERFISVAQLCEKAGYQIARRTDKPDTVNADTQIYIGDTIGELWSMYAAADVAFVGGSLVNIGGHNLLEPAALSLPVITGRFLQNFTAVAKLLLQADALTVVNDVDQLAETVILLLQQENLRKKQGQAGADVIKANQGALLKHMELINKLLWVAPSKI